MSEFEQEQAKMRQVGLDEAELDSGELDNGQDQTVDTGLLQRAIVNPRSLSPQAVLSLQQTYGNQAVQRLLRSTQTVQREARKGNSPRQNQNSKASKKKTNNTAKGSNSTAVTPSQPAKAEANHTHGGGSHHHRPKATGINESKKVALEEALQSKAPPQTPSLQQILESGLYVTFFRDFLRKQNKAHLLDFWHQARAYPQTANHQEAEYIYSKYISSASASNDWIGILSPDVQVTIENDLLPVNFRFEGKAVFNQARDEVWQILNRYYPDFLKSEDYQQMQRREAFDNG